MNITNIKISNSNSPPSSWHESSGRLFRSFSRSLLIPFAVAALASSAAANSIVGITACDCEGFTVKLEGFPKYGTVTGRLNGVTLVGVYDYKKQTYTAVRPEGLVGGTYDLSFVVRDGRVLDDDPVVICPCGATPPDPDPDCCPGPPGPAGPAGPAGPIGPIGLTGAAGPAGVTGLAGAVGPIGPIGPMGLMGAVGPAGPAGATGLAGAVGPIGPIGLMGAVGPSGPAGATGPAGPQGMDGETGATGPAGPPGMNGVPGPAGADGPIGEAGAVGPAGPAGATGPAGPQGMDGAVGPAGAMGLVGLTGSVGPTGATGPVGPAGPAGAVGPIGETGAAGPTGPTGATGPAGQDGVDGTDGAESVSSNYYGDFYALMPGDNAATIAAGSAVEFPQDGPFSNIMRVSNSEFLLPEIGVYKVDFQVSVTEPGQLVLGLDSSGTGNGTIAQLAYTVVGRATGTNQIAGTCLVQTTVTGSTLTVLNPTGNSPALTLTPVAGGTHPVSAHLVIVRLR